MSMVRAHPQVHARFPYFLDGWRPCAKIWYVVMEQLAFHFTHVACGVHISARARAHVQMHASGCGSLFTYLDPLDA